MTRNVADAATLPRQEQQEVKAMSADEVGRFLEAAQGSPYYAVFFALLWTGARRSEVLALRWRDVDLMMGTISIRRRLAKRPGGRVDFAEPKSRHGKRAIEMSPALAIALREHYDRKGGIA